ncbi:hypothetical protein KM043_010526 [Ampulex compressa]|nr:hypothetical protein KM043_010526 [Ampulex compressa]
MAERFEVDMRSDFLLSLPTLHRLTYHQEADLEERIVRPTWATGRFVGRNRAEPSPADEGEDRPRISSPREGGTGARGDPRPEESPRSASWCAEKRKRARDGPEGRATPFPRWPAAALWFFPSSAAYVRT